MECFNSVDGSSRLVVLFGWFRFVCSNGLVIGETKIEIRERHGQRLDLTSILGRIRPALAQVEADRNRISAWQSAKILIADVANWVNDCVTPAWGKEAATRVFHICMVGEDIEIKDPFASGRATEKPIRYLGRAPGSPARAETKYDVSQALSFVATHRRNAEERLSGKELSRSF
jgi:Domain of unknown function (DUF932)